MRSLRKWLICNRAGHRNIVYRHALGGIAATCLRCWDESWEPAPRPVVSSTPREASE